MSEAYLEVDELQRLEEAATNLRDRLLIRLLSHLGCRISEALGIKVLDINMDNRTYPAFEGAHEAFVPRLWCQAQ